MVLLAFRFRRYKQNAALSQRGVFWFNLKSSENYEKQFYRYKGTTKFRPDKIIYKIAKCMLQKENAALSQRGVFAYEINNQKHKNT